jgi:hypothetical protein
MRIQCALCDSVEDECGGPHTGDAEDLFRLFDQRRR